MRKIDRGKLQKKYAFLKPTPITDGLMAFGFECGEGWLNILSELFKSIDKSLCKEERKIFKITQIKEKFGTLRVYYYGGNDRIEELVEKAELQSSITCERCGAKGATQNDSGWISTLCKKCRSLKKKNAD